MTIRQHISRIRGIFKMVGADTRLTDKDIFSLMVKHRDWLLEQLDNKLGLMRMSEVFQVIPCVDLIEVDPVECCGISTSCIIKRTKHRLPNLVNLASGPLIKSVTSLDGSVELDPTKEEAYIKKIKKSTNKYDKSIYYWHRDGYLYFPDIEWDAVRISAFFDESVEKYLCTVNESTYCKDRQDEEFYIPKKLVGRMDAAMFEELGITARLPEQHQIDKNDNTK